ncbi:hypothetical protein ACET3X_006904 [Alternaria dauci]|uniref:Uncharacterized protein n=1 Tax=Alternaria dauci TaxID=48095 RepID=A0ABR3UGH0_9PLEO
MKFITNTLTAALCATFTFAGHAAGSDVFRDSEQNVYDNEHQIWGDPYHRSWAMVSRDKSQPISPALEILGKCIEYCYETARYTVRREGTWAGEKCPVACRESPKYQERSTETWRTLFAQEAQDCENAASKFVASHPRGTVALPGHLKDLGCA